MTTQATASRGAVAALARVDGRKLLFSPIFLSGLVLSLVGVGIFVQTVRTDATATWRVDAWTVGAGSIILALLAMVAANRAGLRDWREETVDQHEALPLGTSMRLAGLLGGVAWPATVAMVPVALAAVWASTRLEVPPVTTIHVIQTGVLVLMLGALGLALASWIPSGFVAPVVAFAFYVVHPGEYEQAWHAAWPFSFMSTVSLASWHVVYLLGLTLILIVAADLRGSRGRGGLAALTVGVVAVTVSLAAILPNACVSPGNCLL